MPTPSLTSSHVPAAKPVKMTWRRFLKRIGFGLVGLLAILLVVFLLLPQWISNEQGRTYVLQQLNKRINAKITISNWNLGWFRPTELHNVTITLPDGSALFTSPKVRSELTLWSILWGTYDLGTTTIDTPQFTLTKYPDGSTSLDALTNPHQPTPTPLLRKMLPTLRGAVQFSGGTVTINSITTRQSIAYTNVKAAFTIASPDAPFHIQLAAIAPDHTLSLTTSFQPIRAWTIKNWPQALAASDIDCTATNLPTALLCDWTTLDSRWQDSLGPTLTSIAISNHPAPPTDATTFHIQIHGSTDSTFIDATLAAHTLNLRTPAILSLPSMSPYHAAVSLPISAPLAAVLTHINPLFAQLQSGDAPINLVLTDLNLNTANPLDAQLSARILFPTMTFKNSGLAAALLQFSSQAEEGTPPTLLNASADPFRLSIADNRFSYDNLTLTFAHHRRIAFRGAVRLDGTIDLMATVPNNSGWGNATLGAITADVPITGTLDAPTITMPR